MERSKTIARWVRPHLLWLLLLAALLPVLWEIPLVSVVHRQAGMRALLQTTLHQESSPVASHQPASVETEALESAMRRLRQANGQLDTDRALGLVALAKNDPAGAQQWLLRRLETTPDDIIARFFLGEAYLRLGDTQAAIEQWETAGAQGQLIELAKELEEREARVEALAALGAVMRLDASDVDSRWLAAEIWREQGNTERALTLYQEIIAIVPQSIGARQLAAEIYIEQGNPEHALALYRAIIAVAPQEPNGYVLSGLIFFDGGEYKPAIAFFEQGLERNPASPRWILIKLGRAYAALGEWPEAIGAYERAIHEDPTHHWDYVLIGDAKCQAGHPQEARSYYEQALALGNESGRVRQAIEYIAQHGSCPP